MSCALGKQAFGKLKSLEWAGSAQLVWGKFHKTGSWLLTLPLLRMLVMGQSHHISVPVPLNCRKLCWSQLHKASPGLDHRPTQHRCHQQH